MQPILLDVSRLIWRQWGQRLPTGIDRVCLAYLDHFGSRANAVVQFRNLRLILGPRDSATLFELLREGGRGFRGRLVALLARAALRQRPSSAQGAFYLNVGHTGLNSAYLPPWLRRRQLRPVYLIHDLIPITCPQYCRPGEATRHEQRIANALQSACGIVVNSDVTRRELADFAHSRGYPMPPAEVAWLGVEQSQPPVRPLSGRPYFVALGTIEARKNHQLLLDIWTRLVTQLGATSPELVIVGQRGWEAQAVIDLLDRPGVLGGHVRELGRCDDASLRTLIAGAQALLMPSFAEGFGLPVVEALALGMPVIASDLAVFREIAGDVPDYLDPRDEDGWYRLIGEYSANGPARWLQLDRAAGFRAPRWSEHFRRVDQFLRALDGPER